MASESDIIWGVAVRVKLQVLNKSGEWIFIFSSSYTSYLWVLFPISSFHRYLWALACPLAFGGGNLGQKLLGWTLAAKISFSWVWLNHLQTCFRRDIQSHPDKRMMLLWSQKIELIHTLQSSSSEPFIEKTLRSVAWNRVIQGHVRVHYPYAQVRGQKYKHVVRWAHIDSLGFEGRPPLSWLAPPPLATMFVTYDMIYHVPRPWTQPPFWYRNDRKAHVDHIPIPVHQSLHCTLCSHIMAIMVCHV